MGFFDDARDAFNSGMNMVDKKSQELESKARVKDLEIKRNGVYSKLGERFYAMAQENPTLRDNAPELFSQIDQFNADIKQINDTQETLGNEIDDTVEARDAEKARRDEAEAARKAATAAAAASAAAGAAAGAVPTAGAGAAATATATGAGATTAGDAAAKRTNAFCSSCGVALKESDKFCPACGAPVVR